MSENKFMARLKGEPTPKSVVEIQNDRLVAPFKSSPMGHIADRDSSVVVAKGAQNWAVNQEQLVPVADDYIGTESDLSGTSRVSGAGLWLNATYIFPATGDETNPVSAIIAPSAKWVLTLCGDSLITQNGSVITLTMLVKIGATHLTTKQFKVRECASQFSQRLAIDFSESEQSVIKAHGGSPLTVQVLCDDEGASATIYSGMTHLTLLQRKIDADLVATDNVLLPEFIENLLEGYIIPADYFSRYDYIEQVEDGGKAMPEFTRNGDNMSFSGWAKPAEEVYTKTEIDDKFTVANAQIDANADAIQKTREDYIQADSEIHQILNNHAENLTTLHNDVDDLGDQVAEIESKIPESASESNPLVTKQQLLDEEMDIRDDLNEGLSELQTQVTHQAAEIATKQDQLTAGDNIIISGNVISATGAGGGAGFDAIVVQELPETGQKGVIYLLAKDGVAPDVYDEYVWIESTQTFELIGTTQVDLTDYVKNTDYATSSKGGVIKVNSTSCAISVTASGLLYASTKSLSAYNDAQTTIFIGKGTLENIKDDLVARAIENAITTQNLTVGSGEGTLYIGDVAGTATIATNNGLDIAAQTKFDTAPTTDDNTTYANALDTSLVRKAQVAAAIADAVSNIDALPDQTGNAGKVLTTDGSTASWQDPSGGTTITLKEYDE